jgi:hypothetical protein
MKKFLKDEENIVQTIEKEALYELYPQFKAAAEDAQERSNKWIVIKTGQLEASGLTFQVAIQDLHDPRNIIYHLYVFKDDELQANIPVRQVQFIPPAHEKRWGLDYFDWLEIQGTFFKWLIENNYKPFVIDQDPKGKVVYTTQESPEVVKEKLAKGEQYSIIAIQAEVFIEKMKAWEAEHKAAKSPIITLDKEIAKPDVKLILP